MKQELLAKVSVPHGQSLRHALEAIDKGATGAVLITDERGHLKGILTDGDIRRALLRGVTLDDPLDPLVSTEFIKADPLMGRADVLDMMKARQIQQVPIIDDNGELIGLHLLREMISCQARPHCAVVMAGGEGKRLRPITEHLPKPMIQVAGRPILERIVLHLIGEGIRHIYLAVNYMADTIEHHFGDGSSFGCRIDYLREDEPLGSGGALSLLPECPKVPLLMMNGDLVTNFRVGELLDFHERGGFAATLGLQLYEHRVPYGCISLDGDHVAGLREKPVLEETINAGVYVISPDLLTSVPRRFFPITDLFEECLANGTPLGGFVFKEDWIDVGQPVDLSKARGSG